ncbi:MAG TPA: GNAT family N-acetyltransferase [Candidatus Acidoferrum sp.]|nr:GNAT family N-acetyltransferase [Candidatus Acidoferrum sp.]
MADANIAARPARREDMPRLLQIEKAAMPSLQYLAGVEDLFFDTSNGELVVVEVDGVPAGFGRITVQPDLSAWFETARVDPAMQKMGVGAALWERRMAIANKLELIAVRMYTTFENEGSKKLGYRNKLDIAMHAREYSLPLADVAPPAAPAFAQVTDPDEADAALLPYVLDYKGYYIANRTFYAANPATTAALAKEGKVYAGGGSAMVCGSRYLHRSALHFGLMGGNLDDCISFAIAKGKEQGVPKVVTMIDKDDEKRAAALTARGFVMAPSNIIMMERML